MHIQGGTHCDFIFKNSAKFNFDTVLISSKGTNIFIIYGKLFQSCPHRTHSFSRPAKSGSIVLLVSYSS